MEQGSEEWMQVRCGKVTASRVADVIAKTKSGWGASRGNYMSELICERLTGATANSFTNAAMEWGTVTEPEARKAYAFFMDFPVEQIGFVDHPGIEMSGASPDGLVLDTGLVEIKCPNTKTHIETLLDGKIPTKYKTQMYWQMACTERDWCDFVSFDPRLPQEHSFFCERVERDEKRVKELEEMVTEFLDELADKISQLNERLAA